MSAQRITIISVDVTNDVIAYKQGDSHFVNERRFIQCPKVARWKALSFLGYKFVGVPPNRYTDDMINAAYKAYWDEAQGKSLGAGEVKTTPPTQPQVRSNTMSTPPTTSVPVGGLEAMLNDIIGTAMAGYVPDVIVDEKMVKELVANAVTELTTNVCETVGELSARIDTLRPKVTHITLKTGETRQMDGIQHYQFPDVLASLSSGVDIMLVGPAGSGKSSIAQRASQALGLDFGSKSVTAQSSEASLTGYMSASGHYVGTSFRDRFQHGGVFLLDEVDNGNPNVLNVLNSALANGFMEFPDGMVKRHASFIGVAVGNTFGNGATMEYVGRNPLDKAFVDRFAVTEIGYDLDIEQAMMESVGLPTAQGVSWIELVRKCRTNALNHSLKMIISPRATLQGAKLLGAGLELRKVVEMTILKGAKPEQASKVLDGVSLK